MDLLLRVNKMKFSSKFEKTSLLENTLFSSLESISLITKNSNEKINFGTDNFHIKKDESSYGSEKELLSLDSCDKLGIGKHFPCQYKNCKKIYTSSYGLKYHMDHGHTIAKAVEKRPFICRINNCGKTYKNNNGLKYHIAHAHKGENYDDNDYQL